MKEVSVIRTWKFVFTLATLSALVASRGAAQSSNASLRGHVRDPARGPVPDARIELRDPRSGYQRNAATNASGFYNIGAIPPGSYTLRVLRLGFTPQERPIVLQIGDVVTADFQMDANAQTLTPVTVSAAGATGTDVRTPEVGANVSTQQIENLPQNNRNFLDFAALAPGVQQRKAGVSAGGASVDNSNLFIDGASYKSDVLPGGVAGQDPSLARDVSGIGRVLGNPFPQNAVQEFRVITQNYKAEYQKASGAVITAATKSGTNVLHGDLFYTGQNEGMLHRSWFDEQKNNAKPEYLRSQFGGSLGGPIVRDRTHFFVSYEGNFQDFDTRVAFNPTSSLTIPDSLLRGEGTFPVPLRSNLFFGKIDHQLSDRQSLMFTANVRHDRDERDFGGRTAEDSRTTVGNDVNTFLLRDTYAGQALTNEAQVSFQRFNWKATADNAGSVRRVYQIPGGDLIRGGNTSFQNFVQDRLSLRNDVTRTAAAHVLKGGVNVDFARYDIDKRLDENPVFRFDPTRAGFGFDVPYEATMQVGNPNLKTNNTQIGAYLQDDWVVTPRLTLNLGVRWDFETDQLNNKFVTPRNVRDSVTAFLAKYPYFDSADYFTNGESDRPYFFGAFQPRLGFSYDLRGTGQTVVFGGGGLFYDRDNYNAILDEKYRFQRPSYRFRFSPAGDPATGVLPWTPSLESRAALLQLVTSGQYNNPELWLLENDTKPPYSVQGSIGVRQSIGALQASVTGSLVNTYHGLRWYFGNRDPANNGNTVFGQNGISAILLSSDDARTWYRALLFQLSKPLSPNTRWGGDLSYTLAKTEANTYVEEDMFALDYKSPAEFDRVPGRFDERHRVVFNLLTRIPYGVVVSTITTLGSGYPYTLSTNCDDPTDTSEFCAQFPRGNGNFHDWDDNPAGKGPRSERPEGEWFGPFGKWAYRNVDLRLQKDFVIRDQRASLFVDAFNIFDFDNFNYDNFQYNLRFDATQTPPLPRHRTGSDATFDSRRVQAGLKYAF